MPAVDFEKVASGEDQTQVVSKAMSIEIIQATLKEKYDGAIDSMITVSEAHEVTDEKTEKSAIEMAAQATRLLKGLDSERKNIIDEPDSFVRGVNGMCRGFRVRLDKVVTNFKTQIKNFQWKKELERRKREKAAQEEVDRIKKRSAKEAKDAGVDAPPVEIVPVVEKKETVTHTDSGASSHIRTSWKMTEILDFSKVPDDCKMLDDKKVKAMIKAGTRKIPGLKIKEVPDAVLRT